MEFQQISYYLTLIVITRAVSTWKGQHLNLSVELCKLTETQFNSVHRLHNINLISIFFAKCTLRNVTITERFRVLTNFCIFLTFHLKTAPFNSSSSQLNVFS